MKKLTLMLILVVVGLTAMARGFKYERRYNDTIVEKEVKELFVYNIGNISIQGQFNDDGTISYFVNGVYVVEGYDYKLDGHLFYTHDDKFFFGKYGNTLGDNFYAEPIFDDVNPFDDVSPFED